MSRNKFPDQEYYRMNNNLFKSISAAPLLDFNDMEHEMIGTLMNISDDSVKSFCFCFQKNLHIINYDNNIVIIYLLCHDFNQN